MKQATESHRACVIGHITVRDAEKWAEYRRQVPATLSAWGGELVFRGRTISVMSGEHAHAETVVLQFPDVPSLHGWFQSPAYQALIALREQAADVVLIGYES